MVGHFDLNDGDNRPGFAVRRGAYESQEVISAATRSNTNRQRGRELAATMGVCGRSSKRRERDSRGRVLCARGRGA